jgi:hypothetical protein
MRQIKQPTPPARKLDPRVDPALSDWIERLLVKNPARRTPSAAQAWDELEELLIARLGARWRRAALLLEPAADDGDRPTPSTAPIDDPGLAPTVLPPVAAVAAPERTARAPRRPARRLGRALRLGVALVLIAGVLFAAVSGNKHPASPERAPASSTTAAPAVSSSPRGGSAAAERIKSGIGDSKSDDPSDDEPDENED